MKNIATIILFFFANNIAFAQDVNECEKIVLQTYEALNQKNADPIIKYLSDDFSTAGHTGSVAKLILPQLFKQLNYNFSNIKKISETKTDVLTLVYEAEVGDKGLRKSTFVFNNKNQLKTLELLNIQVKTLNNGDLKILKNDQKYFTVPFKRVGKLISVEVKLNGIVRTFLVDNGSPKLVLNSAHIEKDPTNETREISNLQGAGGSISNVNIDSIQSLEFGGITMNAQKVLTMDLSHLEKKKKTTFYGLIGYEMIKDYDLLFDYKNKTLTFIKADATEEFLKNNFQLKKQIEVPIEMGAHIPVIVGYINGKKYSLGLDCGSESSLFDIKLKDELKANFSKLETDSLLGANKNIVETLSGKLNSLKIGGVNFKKTKTIFSSISHLNDAYKIKLDGIIGYAILSNQPTLISYVNKKVVFLR